MNANPLALFWEGFTIESYSQPVTQSLLIRLQPADGYLPCCSGYHQHTLAIHDSSIRRVRERDLLHYRVWLGVPVRRVRCATCGPKLEQIRWLLLRNRSNLKDGQALKLEELLHANQPLMTVYVLKDQLKELWYASSETEARQRKPAENCLVYCFNKRRRKLIGKQGAIGSAWRFAGVAPSSRYKA